MDVARVRARRDLGVRQPHEDERADFVVVEIAVGEERAGKQNGQTERHEQDACIDADREPALPGVARLLLLQSRGGAPS